MDSFDMLPVTRFDVAFSGASHLRPADAEGILAGTVVAIVALVRVGESTMTPVDDEEVHRSTTLAVTNFAVATGDLGAQVMTAIRESRMPAGRAFEEAPWVNHDFGTTPDIPVVLEGSETVDLPVQAPAVEEEPTLEHEAAEAVAGDVDDEGPGDVEEEEEDDRRVDRSVMIPELPEAEGILRQIVPGDPALQKFLES